MSFPKTVWQSTRNLIHITTGFGKQPDPLHAGLEAVSSVFIPVLGLAIGFLCALAAVIAQAAGLVGFTAFAGVACLAVLTGRKQINAMVGRPNGLRGGLVLFAAASFYFLIYGLNQLGSIRGLEFLCTALLFLPVSGSLAMVSAASVMPEPETPMPLSSTKGIHMILAAALAMVMMLPSFGITSLAFTAAAVLTGSIAGLIAGRKSYQPELLYAAAAIAELFFILLMLLANKPQIYY